MSCELVIFFKQKAAYEWRISDWSSDVCSSDLPGQRLGEEEGRFDVDVHHLVPARFGKAFERFAPRRAGIVDEDVEPLFASLQVLGQRAAALDARQVDRQADDLARIAGLEIGDRLDRKSTRLKSSN